MQMQIRHLACHIHTPQFAIDIDWYLLKANRTIDLVVLSYFDITQKPLKWFGLPRASRRSGLIVAHR